MTYRSIILASTSPFRKTLLARLGLEFQQLAPDCDETPLPNEPAIQLVERLAIEKAESVYTTQPDSAVVIGSDQVADLDGTIIGKPHTHEAAVAQLTSLAGKSVWFHTGVCLITCDTSLHQVVSTTVTFKSLTTAQIERYLDVDKPYGCAASFKSECLGSAIVESMKSEDPTALIGLPLITVATFLNQAGIEVP